jgi:phosphoribosylformylglycinamidine synthase
MTPAECLFSESAGRFVATVAPEKAETLEGLFKGLPLGRVGEIIAEPRLTITAHGGRPIVDLDLKETKAAWKAALAEV